MPQSGRIDLSDLFRRCHDNEEDAWEEFCAWFHRMASKVLAQYAVTPVQKEQAEEKAREKLSRRITKAGIQFADRPIWSAVSLDENEKNYLIVGYVQTALKNAAKDELRHPPHQPLPPGLTAPSPSPEDVAKWHAQLECAETVLKSMEPDSRFLFVLKLEGVSGASIKSDLEYLFGVFITVDAVNVRFFRMRAEIRERCLKGIIRG